MRLIKGYNVFVTEANALQYDDKFGITPELESGLDTDYDKIESDVNDILIELVDDGFFTEISCVKGVILDKIYVDITKNDIYSSSTIQYGDKINIFNTDDVKEYVMMLIDYMKDKYNNLEIKYTLFAEDIYNPSEKCKNFIVYPDSYYVNGFCIEFKIINMNNISE